VAGRFVGPYHPRPVEKTLQPTSTKRLGVALPRSIKISVVGTLPCYGMQIILHSHGEQIIAAKALSSCFLELYSQTSRLTGTFTVSSGSTDCSRTITERRHENRTSADLNVGLYVVGSPS
jgi:hypothetical protein